MSYRILTLLVRYSRQHYKKNPRGLQPRGNQSTPHWVALRKKAVLALSFIALSRDRLECMHGALPKRFIHVFTLQIFNDVFRVLPPQNRCRFDGSCHKDTFLPVVFNSYYTTFKR